METTRRGFAQTAGMAAAFAAIPAARAAEDDGGRWADLAAQLFPGRTLLDGASVLSINAPYRAEDAAVVPVDLAILLADGDPRHVAKLTLIIDINPAPMAATFTPGVGAGIDRISTRVRVNDYTNMHAVAEMTDGSFYSVARFVKAAGGCSAPALKQASDGIIEGTIRFREFAAANEPGAAGRREAQVMIRHPNYSGMQMDQISHLYIAADFLQTMQVWQGDQLLLAIEAGISIAENPAFRFRFKPNNAAAFRVLGEASDGRHFSGSFPADRTAT